MNIRQWSIWKAKPEGFEKAHWFVIISGQERLDAERRLKVNSLVCFSLRGEALDSDVRLNGADGFEAPTVCQCDLVYFLDKNQLKDCIGAVTWERQQQIKSRIKELLRL